MVRGPRQPPSPQRPHASVQVHSVVGGRGPVPRAVFQTRTFSVSLPPASLHQAEHTGPSVHEPRVRPLRLPSHLRSRVRRERDRAPQNQGEPSLDQRSGRADEPHDQGSHRQTLPLRLSRAATITPHRTGGQRSNFIGAYNYARRLKTLRGLRACARMWRRRTGETVSSIREASNAGDAAHRRGSTTMSGGGNGRPGRPAAFSDRLSHPSSSSPNAGPNSPNASKSIQPTTPRDQTLRDEHQWVPRGRSDPSRVAPPRDWRGWTS